VVCLAADGSGELRELCTKPFTTSSIRKLRLYADPGGVPNLVDVRLGNIKVQAEEITGHIPLRDQGDGMSIWVILGASAVAVAAAFWVYRKYLRREQESASRGGD